MALLMSCLSMVSALVPGAASPALLELLPVPTFTPEGELGARIAMTQHRLREGMDPVFTRDFILADVALRPDYPRRFDNFSGDISGRYLGAVALMPWDDADLAGLAKDIIGFQRADGRFGAENLIFEPEQVGREHMALLWGNGRLLVGLMEYYAASGDTAALDSARRLGDFLLSVQKPCSDEKVRESLVSQAANGYICFTQLIEGLAMLYAATDEPAYLESAEEISGWFVAERGVQHSHGYLSTLRGVMMLHQVTGKAEHLAMASAVFKDLLVSPDYVVFGGVYEFFSSKCLRDEGCSEADFLRLALQLWSATGETVYINAAERCLYNQFYANQFATGDFGHHLFTEQGLKTWNGVARAWWCCTMHGLRAFRDVADCAVVSRPDGVQVDLFVEGVFEKDGWKLRLTDGFDIHVEAAPEGEQTLTIRQPGWSGPVTVELNGKPQPQVRGLRLLRLRRNWVAGDTVHVALAPRTVLQTRDGQRIALEDLGEDKVDALLFYGPRILGMDAVYDTGYHAEPWLDNVIVLPEVLIPENTERTEPLELPGSHFKVTYWHSGFPDLCQAVLRPYSEESRHRQSMFSMWHHYKKKQ